MRHFDVRRWPAARGLHLLRVLTLLEGEVWPCTFLPQKLLPEDLHSGQVHWNSPLSLPSSKQASQSKAKPE